MRLGEKLRSVIAQKPISSSFAEIKPEEALFPWERRWFKKGKETGANNFDLHNAVRKHVILIGTQLEITRKFPSEQDGKTIFRLAYIGPANPFINPRTGKVGHVFYNCEAKDDNRIVTLSDIMSWRKIGSLPKEKLLFLKKIREKLDAQKR